MLVGVLLLIQVSLGISNVLFSLPIAVAVAHNGGAALLLGSLVLLNFRIRRR
jgi:cytochrome c oxidase assembly protein subunit 15